MAEKKIQENPLPEALDSESSKVKDATTAKNTTAPAKEAAPVSVKVTAPCGSAASPRLTLASLGSLEPGDLYRRLLPAVLFVLTFVTVMAMLLIYMDTVALGAQQFRVNMSRDVELERIPQESASLVAYVRQLHLAPRPPPEPRPPPPPTAQVRVLDSLLGPIDNGTFVEFVSGGERSASTAVLEARGWRGVLLVPAARDFLRLRARAAAAHACLSHSDHPIEMSYPESEVFRSRVLCLPLYTVLLAAAAPRAQYVRLPAPAARPALAHLPFHAVSLKVIEVMSSDPGYRNQTGALLAAHNYTVAAAFPHSVMYVLN